MEVDERLCVRRGLELGQAGENYIVALDEERIYALAPGAYYVWLLCDGTLTVYEIAAKIAQQIGADIESIVGVVSAIVSKLAELGLVDLSGLKESSKAS